MRRISQAGIAVANPSLATVGVNGFEYVASVYDAAGRLLGATTTNASNGTSTVLIDARTVDGGVNVDRPLTIEVSGTVAVSDPDTIDSDSATGRQVTVLLASSAERRVSAQPAVEAVVPDEATDGHRRGLAQQRAGVVEAVHWARRGG